MLDKKDIQVLQEIMGVEFQKVHDRFEKIEARIETEFARVHREIANLRDDVLDVIDQSIVPHLEDHRRDIALLKRAVTVV